MKLVELEPTFFIIEEPGKSYRMTDDIKGADGVQFLCPKCFAANGGPIGTHSALCWAPHVPQSEFPRPGRWQLVGAGYHDLTLIAGSSSVLLTEGCHWHGYIRNGEVTS